MTINIIRTSIFVLICLTNSFAQKSEQNIENNSLNNKENKNQNEPEKVLHAEPLFIDLIRDLGARKGEKEWNIGLGLTDNSDYDEYSALIEYEWAPADRLGLEVELPFSFYPSNHNGAAPGNNLNSLKLAAQYSFYVSQKYGMSMALGYIHEFELAEFRFYDDQTLIQGNVYNPFFITAKRLGNNFHSLLYTGPAISHHFESNTTDTSWQINSNIHYMISGTKKFIGIEVNKAIEKNNFDMVIRPQMRVAIAENLLIGIVTGIPISRENERLSSFLRLIYEPGHQKHTKSKK